MSSSYNLLIPQITLRETVKNWMKEDCPSFDYGGFVVGDAKETAVLLCKSDGFVAGMPFVNEIFHQLNCRVKWFVDEGTHLTKMTKIAEVTGMVCNLLLGERLALNIITRASGVSTLARNLNLIKCSKQWHGEIAGTRKTTPGFRIVEKYSLLVGGISTHRYDLSSMVMLKDNHIWSAGDVFQAVKKARDACGFSLKIEVECRSKEEAFQAFEAGADVVMLDNFEPLALHDAAEIIKTRYPHCLIEASGGIRQENIHKYMGPHVDVISLSQTTQGYDTMDFSLKLLKEGRDPLNPLVIKS